MGHDRAGYGKAPAGFAAGRPESVTDVSAEHWTSWMGNGAKNLPAVNGVFKGGGPKGVAFAGALAAMEGKVAFRAVSGASAGAITAALVAAGYSAAALTDRISELQFDSLLDERVWGLPTDPARKRDDTVRLAYWDYKQRESPDVVTQIIKNNDDLSKMMDIKAESRREWASKSWSRYLQDYAYWMVGSSDSLKLTLASNLIGDSVIDLLVQQIRAQDLPRAISSKLKDKKSILRILLAVYYLGGAFKGDVALAKIERWLQEGLTGTYDPRQTVKFKDMPIDLHIVATDLTNKRLLNFPGDLADEPYTFSDPEDFSVAQAVRASMSIPLCFEPVVLQYGEGTPDAGNHAVLVDGGVLSNYPCHTFVGDEHPTVGFWLGDDMDSIVPQTTSTIAGYSAAMFGALQDSHDRTIVKLMGDRLVSCPIDLRIPLTAAERKQRSAAVAQLNEKIKKAQADEMVVAEWDLTVQRQEIEKELRTGRPCGTLDFALDGPQKQRLIDNGREAGEKALEALRALEALSLPV